MNTVDVVFAGGVLVWWVIPYAAGRFRTHNYYRQKIQYSLSLTMPAKTDLEDILENLHPSLVDESYVFITKVY